MPYLYCEKHGEEREAPLRERSRESFNGEGVVVVKSNLISGPWLCDSCNRTLNKGDPASIVSFLTEEMADNFYAYDFSYERNYFEFEGDDVALYGPEWPE